MAAVPAAPPAPPAASTQLAQPAVRIVSSLDLTLADVQRLERELVAARNRFVCLQLATMAREQHAAVRQALAAGDSRQLAAAARLHFATLEAEGALVAGAVFYPRDTSRKGGAASCGTDSTQRPASGSCPEDEPHVYVELLVTRQPGEGWGSLLLAAVERHAAAHAATSLAAPSRTAPRAIKLLSVGSAQQFYRRCGYGEPDERREMRKVLAAVALPAGGAAA